MLVKIFMRRRMKEGNLNNIFALIRKIRAIAMNQHGYISGETLVDYNDPKETLVISTWQSMEDWMKWNENPLRKEIEVQLEELLEKPTEYKVFVYSKYHLKITGDSSLG